jgi:hypothetical protein
MPRITKLPPLNELDAETKQEVLEAFKRFHDNGRKGFDPNLLFVDIKDWPVEAAFAYEKACERHVTNKVLYPHPLQPILNHNEREDNNSPAANMSIEEIREFAKQCDRDRASNSYKQKLAALPNAANLTDEQIDSELAKIGVYKKSMM